VPFASYGSTDWFCSKVRGNLSPLSPHTADVGALKLLDGVELRIGNTTVPS